MLSMDRKVSRLWWIGLVFSLMLPVLLIAALPSSAQAACPDAPPPRLIVGAMGRVTPGDPNNVRDVPARSGALIGAIAGGDTFEVLEGPVCADGLNWWKVTYGDLTGWTVEGSGADYWVEPVLPEVPTNTPQPTAIPTPTSTPEPAHVFEPPRPVVNILTGGVQARVISDDPTSQTIRLAVRATPGVNGDEITRLDAGAIVTVLAGVAEVDSLIWREVQLEDGRTGWTAEGFWNNRSQSYERALLPACPYTEKRLAFDIGRYIYTADHDGSNACIFDRLYLPIVHTFYPYYVYLPNVMVWSPAGTQFAYIDFPDANTPNQDLYILSADGLTRRRITEGSGVYHVDWSPDGARLLFSRRLAGQATPNIWIMREDGTGLSALTSGDNRKVWGAWLADSESVVYVENIGEERSQMGPTPQEFIFYTVNVAQGGLREIYRTDREISSTLLSPDRTRLKIGGWVLEPIEGSRFAESTAYEAVLLSLPDGEQLPLAADFTWGAWLPDGSGWYDRDDTTVTLYAPDGTELSSSTLTHPIDAIGYVRFVGWVSDHEYVLLSSGRDVDHQDDELLRVDVRDGTVTTLIGPVGD